MILCTLYLRVVVVVVFCTIFCPRGIMLSINFVVISIHKSLVFKFSFFFGFIVINSTYFFLYFLFVIHALGAIFDTIFR